MSNKAKVESTVSIANIELRVGDQKVSMSLEQARALKKTLEELFPETKIQYVPSAPIVIEREREHWPFRPSPWWGPDIICKTSGDSTLCLTSRDA